MDTDPANPPLNTRSGLVSFIRERDQRNADQKRQEAEAAQRAEAEQAAQDNDNERLLPEAIERLYEELPKLYAMLYEDQGPEASGEHRLKGVTLARLWTKNGVVRTAPPFYHRALPGLYQFLPNSSVEVPVWLVAFGSTRGASMLSIVLYIGVEDGAVYIKKKDLPYALLLTDEALQGATYSAVTALSDEIVERQRTAEALKDFDRWMAERDQQ